MDLCFRGSRTVNMFFKPIVFVAIALLMCQVAHSQLQGYATQNGGTNG